jgi:hypothetical protein
MKRLVGRGGELWYRKECLQKEGENESRGGSIAIHAHPERGLKARDYILDQKGFIPY